MVVLSCLTCSCACFAGYFHLPAVAQASLSSSKHTDLFHSEAVL